MKKRYIGWLLRNVASALRTESIKYFMTCFIVITLVTFSSTSAFAGWLIYHKPEFKGKVIDAETKEPIGGVVVVAKYFVHPIISGPGGGSAYIIHIKEALTDEKGEFHIPSYTTIIQPNSIEDNTTFIIYKPGYGSFPHQRVSPPKPMSSPAIERFFTKDSFGKQGEIILSFRPPKKGKGTYGVVELPRLKTRAERLRAQPSPPSNIKKECSLLYKAINEERKGFGLKPVGR